MPAAYKSAKSRALLLGAGVLLITSQFTHSQGLGDQQQSQGQLQESHGKSVVHVDVSDLNNLVSAAVESERRTLITVPIVNGVAEPVHQNDLGQSIDAGSSGDGQRLFEMDHQVPSPEILRETYPNEGRTIINDKLDTSISEQDDSSGILKRELTSEPESLDKLSSLPLPNNDNNNNKSNDDDNKSSVKGEKESIYAIGVEALKSLWDSITGADIVSTSEPGVLNVYIHEEVDPQDKPADSSTANPKKQNVAKEKAGDNIMATEKAVKGTKDTNIKSNPGIDTNTVESEKIKVGKKNTKIVQSETGQFVVVNKLNKNYDDAISEEDEEDDSQSLLRLHAHSNTPDSNAGIQGSRTRNRVLGHRHHHHHHVNHKTSQLQLLQEKEKEENWQLWQKQRQSFVPQNSAVEDSSLNEVVIVDENPFIFAAVARQHQSPFQMDQSMDQGHVLISSNNGDSGDFIERAVEERDVGEDENENIKNKRTLEDGDDLDDEEADNKQSSSTKNLALVQVEEDPGMPESIRDRGLIPSVNGAHHCTPQFCVNVSISDDGKYATFHVERPLSETGWISLGIGYAMTMADLLIFWPNPTSENGGGPRGAVLSRRTSHAYVEPQLVGQKGHGPFGDSIKEASLYPPNEYVLHNSNPGAAISAASVFPDDSKFIVQFTRPVRIKNREFKLTPGEEQDFCWAYSPKPISPDSVADPAAHIAQHLSVGSFAMDVGANQPKLKEVFEKQKIEIEKADAKEKNQKSDPSGGVSKDGNEKSDSKNQHPTESSAKSSSSTHIRPISVVTGFVSLVASFICVY
ncbi:hypothetical protein BGZ76_002777 [Entomortierella beljakovae]|nr:hypothetical protein BGZ76_002777 [Entomortierella beljakovae]